MTNRLCWFCASSSDVSLSEPSYLFTACCQILPRTSRAAPAGKTKVYGRQPPLWFVSSLVSIWATTPPMICIFAGKTYTFSVCFVCHLCGYRASEYGNVYVIYFLWIHVVFVFDPSDVEVHPVPAFFMGLITCIFRRFTWLQRIKRAKWLWNISLVCLDRGKCLAHTCDIENPNILFRLRDT